MATYTQQYSSGSATAAGNLGAQGIVTTGAVGINPTHLAYGWYAVDASGRIWVTGTVGATLSAATVTAFISGGTANVQTLTAQAGAPAGITVSTATGGSLVTILAGNASRKGVIITNNATGNLFLGFTTAMSASGPKMGLMIGPGGSYSDFGFDRSTGVIYGVYDVTASAHNVSVSEWT